MTDSHGDARFGDYDASHGGTLAHQTAQRVADSSEPVADEPMRRVASEKDLDQETQLDRDYVLEKDGIETEAVENRWSSHSSSDDGPKRKPLNRMQSSATTATTATTASSMDMSRTESQEAPLKKQPWWRWLLLQHRTLPPIPKERSVSREYNANLFSKLSFQWMTPLMAKGYQRPLELNDIWRVNPDRSANVLADRLEDAFKRRVQKGHKRPLLAAMHETFKESFYIGAFCQLTMSVLQVVNPFILRYLIAFAGEAYYAEKLHYPAPKIGRGVGLVVGITCIQIIQNLAANQMMYHGMMNGGQARAALISLVFDKSLRISGRAKAGGPSTHSKPEDMHDQASPGSEAEKRWFKKIIPKTPKKKSASKKSKSTPAGGQTDEEGYTNGRIVNLMSTDTYRIDQASGMFHLIWTAPISIIITLVLLLINLKASALAGYGLLCASMPLLGKAIKTLIARRKAINKITDQRVGLTQEVLHAVRFIKYFGWETSFLQRLGNLRSQEIRSIQFILAIRNGINAISMSMPVFAAMLAFIAYAYTHTGPEFNPAIVFSSLALFNSIRIPLNMLPLVIGQVTDAVSSVGRIQDFLLAEDEKDEAIWDYENKNAVSMKHASFTWEKAPAREKDQAVDATKNATQIRADQKAAKKAKRTSKKQSKGVEEEKRTSKAADAAQPEDPIFTLNDVDFTLGRNELIAVIGGVGSGKTSLLAALAGDMRKTNGSMTLGATRAFCPQSAWIQNATLKENILFGKNMKHRWYNEVIDACALRPDLEMLPGGDLTEIGEKGITVSGGQKQRLNIARAIYFDSDIILLDDPLSAVDAHVGRHIMDEAICGLLDDKCRILATHQLWVLNRVDRIVWMDEGRIRAIGTYNDLMQEDDDFRKLLASNSQEESRKQEGEEDEVEEEKKAHKKRKGKKPSGALMQAEERAVASVSWEVYYAYVKASGSFLVFPLVFLLLVLSQGALIVTSLWLSWWTSGKFGYSTGTYVGVYAALGATQAILMFLFSVALSVFGTQASKVMLHRAVTKVLRAPMSFFDTTPLGRITNRFSKDIDTMDNTLTDNLRFFLVTMAMIVSVFILIIAYYYYFAVALGPLFVLFLFSASFYRASAREVKRHESVLRSTVFAKFSEAVTGTATIRAYGLQARFRKSIRDAVDDMDSAYFLTFANQRWLSTRLDLIGNCLVFILGMLVVTSRFSINPSTGGLVLSYILTIVQMIQFTIRQLAEVENNMNATERIHYYGKNLEEEPPLSSPNDKSIANWPQQGQIEFTNVEMRYRPGLPLVLQGLNLSVAGGERVGVVGRTGAGKSSIMSTLFRLVELSGGSISIDGVDIASVGLETLRSRLSIIPQDPTLFRGTVRNNLDPFGKYTDHQLWSALQSADLVGEAPSSSASGSASDTDSIVSEKKAEAEAEADSNKGNRPASPNNAMHTNNVNRITLDSPVSEEGLNFSLGQRQLMALARALVRNSQIIVCDEATSSVDMETDERIQRTIATGFKGKTLLCIAHRLKTILGYHRIIVMDQGQIVEIGRPKDLWNAKGSIFRSMCERGGIYEQDF